MKKIIAIAIAVLFLFVGCGDSTGPTQEIRNKLVVIDIATGSISETVNLYISGYYEVEISSEGDFLYIIEQNLITKFDLSSMTVEQELFIPESETNLTSAALSEDDSLLFVLDLTGMLYTISTADMAVTDTLAINPYSFDTIEMRPGAEMLYMKHGIEYIFILDTSQMIFTDTLNIFSESEIFFSDSGDEMYLSCGGWVNAYDSDTGESIREQFFPGIVTRMEAPRESSSIFILWATLSGTQPDFMLVDLDKSTFAVQETMESSVALTIIRFLEPLSRLFLYTTEDSDISVLDMPGFKPVGDIEVDECVTKILVSPASDELYCFINNSGNSDAD